VRRAIERHHNALVSTLQFYLLWFYLLWFHLLRFHFLWFHFLWQVMGHHATLWLMPIEGAGPTVDAARREASWGTPSWGAPPWERRSSPPLCLLGLARLALGNAPHSKGAAAPHTLKERPCRLEPSERLRRGQLPWPKLLIVSPLTPRSTASIGLSAPTQLNTNARRAAPHRTHTPSGRHCTLRAPHAIDCNCG